ncbi:MAG: hypothetical protein QF615_02300 [Planctomycetota bacterium]|nr:hypothetical protein [Planctomycetota bacterium]
MQDSHLLPPDGALGCDGARLRPVGQMLGVGAKGVKSAKDANDA